MKIALHNNCCKKAPSTFDFHILDSDRVMDTIEHLKHQKPDVGLIIRLLNPDPEAFALLYDFADAFIIAGYEDVTESIDPLLDIRMYNDDIKPIYLELGNNFLYEEIDDIIAYSKLSNIEGLFISNLRLLKYCKAASNDILSIIADCKNDDAKVASALEFKPDILAVSGSVIPVIDYFKGRKLQRITSKL